MESTSVETVNSKLARWGASYLAIYFSTYHEFDIAIHPEFGRCIACTCSFLVFVSTVCCVTISIKVKSYFLSYLRAKIFH